MKTVTCSCGYVAVGENADELLAAVEAHIEAAHNAKASEAREVPITTPEAKQ